MCAKVQRNLQNWWCSENAAVFICMYSLLNHVEASEYTLNPFTSILHDGGKFIYLTSSHFSDFRFLNHAWRVINSHIIFLKAKCCMGVWDLAEKYGIHRVFFFFPPDHSQLVAHLISGAKAYYFPNGNLNLLNCLQTRLFHVAQWEKLSALAPNAFLRIPLFPKPYLLWGHSIIIS